jgi:hypothetical protein
MDYNPKEYGTTEEAIVATGADDAEPGQPGGLEGRRTTRHPSH